MNGKFSQIILRNWKNFPFVEAALQRRVFLIGPNASGKSNFLDAFRFLRDLASPGGGFSQALLRRGGLSAEAWLLADGERVASFLGIARSTVPDDPEALPNPKEMMVALARRSRKRAIREDMVPREGSGHPIGPAYSSRLIECALYHWRPDVAALSAPSLERAIACLTRLVTTYPCCN